MGRDPILPKHAPSSGLHICGERFIISVHALSWKYLKSGKAQVSDFTVSSFYVNELHELAV